MNLDSEKYYIKSLIHSKRYNQATFEEQEKMLDEVLDKKLVEVLIHGIRIGEESIRKQLNEIKYSDK